MPGASYSATALETAVIGFLGECCQHPDVLDATSISSRERRQTERAPLRAQLSEIEDKLATIADQLRNCAKALVRGQTTALDEVLREQADMLHEEKQRLIVEREQVRIELAACEEGDINTGRVSQALKKFSDLLPTLSQEEQRDLVTLFLERVELRPASDNVAKAAVGTRLLELRLKLRVERLVEGMAEQILIEERTARASAVPAIRPLVLNLKVALAPSSGTSRPVTLLAPFHCELGVTRRGAAPKPEPAPMLHPIHRARAWQRRLEKDRSLNRLKLAAEEGLSPGSITHHMKLLQLADDIQGKLLDLTKAEDVRRYGLNRMKALADLSLDEQRQQFAAIG
jgi:hypothetical protein